MQYFLESPSSGKFVARKKKKKVEKIDVIVCQIRENEKEEKLEFPSHHTTSIAVKLSFKECERKKKKV